MADNTRSRPKEISLRYAGTCVNCGATIPQGAQGIYDRSTKTVYHVECPPPVLGVAGASAEREYEKRHRNAVEKVERQTEEIQAQYKDNMLGRYFAKREISQKVNTRAVKRAENWNTGAVGEEFVAARLDKLASHDIVSLHDRLRVETKRANIDHIAITPWGVWVIDAKRYKNKRPELRTEGGLLKPYQEHLYVGGYNEGKRVRGIHEQILDVQLAVPDVPVRGILCFVDADWGLFGNGFVVNDIRVCYPRLLEKHLVERAKSVVDVDEVTLALARHFPQA